MDNVICVIDIYIEENNLCIVTDYDEVNSFSNVDCEILALDSLNNVDPGTWTQIVDRKDINLSALNNNMFVIPLKDFLFSTISNKNEVRFKIKNVRYNLLCKTVFSQGFLSSCLSRGTLAICCSFDQDEYVSANGIIPMAENGIFCFLITVESEWIPRKVLAIERYSNESNVGRCIAEFDVVETNAKNEYKSILSIEKIYNSDFESDRKTYVFAVLCFHRKYGYSKEFPIISKIPDMNRKTEYIIENYKWYETIEHRIALTFSLCLGKDRSDDVIQLNKGIRIATWGSCYLRNMFNSIYNADWKKAFSIVSNYFWFSPVSAMSSPIQDSTWTFFSEAAKTGNNLNNVKRELFKTGLLELRDNKPEYLLIDFYTDAINGFWQIAEKTYVGQGLSFSPDGALQNEYEEYIQKRGKKIDFRSGQFWSIWTKYTRLFCDEIVSLGLQSNVILVYGDFCRTFVDHQGKISCLSEVRGRQIDMNVNKARIQLWNNMNKFFISLLPNTKVLKMSQYGYRADANHKLISVNHMEPNYYRSEFAELCKIILMDKM